MAKGNFLNRFLSLDMLGRRIELTYKGRSTNKTNFGAIFTILLVLVLTSIGLHDLAHVWTNNQIKTVQEHQNWFNTSNSKDDVQMTPADVGFDLAFGFDDELDPKYGSFNVSLVEISNKYERRFT